MFKVLGEKLQKRALEAVKQNVSVNRIRKFTPVEKVSSVAVLYSAEGDALSDDFYEFIRGFEKRSTTIDVVVVHRGKQKPVTKDCRCRFYFIGQEEKTWYGSPKSSKIPEVLQKSHEYFIDLTLSKAGVCKYLANSSMAHFKIGGINYPNSPFDLTIEVEKGTDLKYFEEQMMSYLQKIS